MDSYLVTLFVLTFSLPIAFNGALSQRVILPLVAAASPTVSQ